MIFKTYKLAITIFLLFLILNGCKTNSIISINNPLNVRLGDPYVLFASDGKYYMYGTDDSGTINGFGAYSSSDLNNWKFEGTVYSGDNHPWAKRWFWAPEVYQVKDKYYLFYSADAQNGTKEMCKIAVAVSTSPTGPFVDVSDKPLFSQAYPIIDANVLEFKGKFYLYYSRCAAGHAVQSEISEWAKLNTKFKEIEESWIYGVELAADFTHTIGEPVLLLQPPLKLDDIQAEWESRSVTSGEANRRWTEGSFAFVANNQIYMMYSANYFGGSNYAVGYATSNHPLGTFIKASNNPVLEKNTHKGGNVTGTGHNAVFKTKSNQYYCVYHGRTSKTGNARVVFIDKIDFNKQKQLFVERQNTVKND